MVVVTTMVCERCDADRCEIHYSIAHKAWLCLRCHLRWPSLARQVELQLGPAPATRAEVSTAVGRDPKDRSVGRALGRLVSSGRAIKDDAGYCEAAP